MLVYTLCVPICCSVSSSISLNASIFASVCLASRLPTSFHAFVVVSLAVVMFALFPDFRLRIKVYTSPSYIPGTSLHSSQSLVKCIYKHTAVVLELSSSLYTKEHVGTDCLREVHCQWYILLIVCMTGVNIVYSLSRHTTVLLSLS